MIAILLCAGFATRMYPLTENFPKSLLEVAGKPVLDYLLQQLFRLPGLKDTHLVTNARDFAHFETWHRAREAWLAAAGIQLRLYNDGATSNANRRGAVGDLAFVLEQLPALQPALVAAGDNIFCFSLAPLWQRFVTERCNFVLALRATDPTVLRRTGVLELDTDDRVLALYEKPAAPPTHWICPALYFLQPEALQFALEYATNPDAADAPGHFIAALAREMPIYALRINGSRFDIGSLDDYKRACRELGGEGRGGAVK